MGIDLWDELTENVKTAMEKSLETLKTRDVENIPGAKEHYLGRKTVSSSTTNCSA